jgi:hypothetical protein
VSGPGATPRAQPTAPKGVTSPAVRFRREIDKALAEGAELQNLLLRLTLSDTSRLMRDPATAVEDIHYDSGVMRFLGVKVQKGGVDASVLEQIDPNALPPEEAEVAPPPAKKKRATKAKTSA